MDALTYHVRDRKVAERLAVTDFMRRTRRLGKVTECSREHPGLPWRCKVVPISTVR